MVTSRSVSAMCPSTTRRMPAAASFHAHAERAGDLLADRCGRGGKVELHAAAEKIVGRENAEHQIGVGDGGELAAAAVADRTGHGAGAVRSDPQQAGLDAGDRAAAGADGANVDHRGVEVKAADLVGAGDERHAVDHQSDVETRAAHVGGDDVVVADLLRQLQRAHDAAGRAARHQQYRLARRFACRDDAAGGIEHVELAAKAALAQQAFDAVEIVGDFRARGTS